MLEACRDIHHSAVCIRAALRWLHRNIECIVMVIALIVTILIVFYKSIV